MPSRRESPGRRRLYFLLEFVSAAAGIAAIPLIVLGLLGVIDGILYWLIGWIVLELVLLFVRPLVLSATDDYKPPRGPVP